MSVGSSILSALFVMLVVFIVLISLWLIIRIFSFVITRIESVVLGKKSEKAS